MRAQLMMLMVMMMMMRRMMKMKTLVHEQYAQERDLAQHRNPGEQNQTS